MAYLRSFDDDGSKPKELGILKIVKEDVLRILCEKSEKVSLEILEDEIKVTRPLISKALEELEKSNLVAIQEGSISLTERGQKNAESILDRYFVLEDYFEKAGSKIGAHAAAHILEHYVSGEVINNLKKLSTLKTQGVPLTKLGLDKEGMITNVTFSDYELFERIVSMGLVMGEKIKVTHKIPHGVVVKVGNKKFALDRSIAEEIKAVEHGQS